MAFTELMAGGGGLAYDAAAYTAAWLTGGGEADDVGGGVEATAPSLTGTLQSVPVNPTAIENISVSISTCE